ncbi:MAG: hypothetical protein R1F52_03560 [Candidatus Nitrosoabyssus spongiisocia]|nr:MAG: hypothetical protein R1F52_03560 [Nitrosopumilaceae archaeon AB1(1)]
MKFEEFWKILQKSFDKSNKQVMEFEEHSIIFIRNFVPSNTPSSQSDPQYIIQANVNDTSNKNKIFQISKSDFEKAWDNLKGITIDNRPSTLYNIVGNDNDKQLKARSILNLFSHFVFSNSIE